MQPLPYLDSLISNQLLLAQQTNVRAEELHGKLSGSILGNPLQQQILHVLGVPAVPHDSFVLRKFQRGHDVEAWVLAQIPGIVVEQKAVLYRGVTGHLDALVDMAAWDMPELGIIPHEIKSITNMNWNWLFGSGKKYAGSTKGPKWAHKLQAALYALATDAKYYALHYIAADDYRLESFVGETAAIAPEIDVIIDEVDTQLLRGKIPVFAPREDWQAKPENRTYLPYPGWVGLTEPESLAKLQLEYPAAYQRLQSFAAKKTAHLPSDNLLMLSS